MYIVCALCQFRMFCAIDKNSCLLHQKVASDVNFFGFHILSIIFRLLGFDLSIDQIVDKKVND